MLESSAMLKNPDRDSGERGSLFSRIFYWAKRGVIVIVILAVFFVVSNSLSKRGEAKNLVVSAPEKKTVVEVLVATGRIQSRRSSRLGPETTGVVASLEVDEGDVVEKGQVLARLVSDTALEELRLAERRLETAKAELESLKSEVTSSELSRAEELITQRRTTLKKKRADLMRTTELGGSGVVSTEQLEEAQRGEEEARSALAVAELDHRILLEKPREEELQVAEARIAEATVSITKAQRELERREIRAPFAGIVTRRQVEPGQSVTLGDLLLTLADLDSREIFIETDELNLGRLKLGQNATIISVARPDFPFQAQVTELGSEVDPGRGVITIRLRAKEYPEGIPLNVSVDASIEIKRVDGIPAVPVGSIVQKGQTTSVLVVEGGLVVRRAVTVKARSDEWIAVEGVEWDDQIISDASSAREGQKVSK